MIHYLGMYDRRSLPEHDACALAMVASRAGRASFWPLRRALAALEHMHHRAGGVAGEGDGCGVQTDIPRRLWADRLGPIAFESRFAVAHLAGPDPARVLASDGAELLWLEPMESEPSALGPDGRDGTPALWQAALLCDPGRSLLGLWLELERAGIHVASLSRHSVVYKALGDVDALRGFALDLGHPLFATRVALAHSRYSTNTLPAFERVQPFGRIAHNGEINTIRRMRLAMPGLGIQPIDGASDTQDLDLLLARLIELCGVGLAEALAMVTPTPRGGGALTAYHRALAGPLAQGPAAIVGRCADTLVGQVDRLGLRPLWRMTSPTELWLASEPGVVSVSELDSEPVPLAAGEQVVVELQRPSRFRPAVFRSPFRGPAGRSRLPLPRIPAAPTESVDLGRHRWTRDDVAAVEAMAATGNEPIGSLGYDGPLAVLDDAATVADHFKEEVAVVTNPSIDRDRELEHFSLDVPLGRRPRPGEPACMWRLRSPLLASRLGLPWVRVATAADAADRAAQHVREGARLILLDDRLAGSDVDPHLALARVSRRLRACRLDRSASVALASAGLRNLHDIMLALGSGAACVEPYAMYAVAAGAGSSPRAAVRNLAGALEKGIEKVLSTMGTHDLAGYGPAFASIGLHPDEAAEFDCPGLLPGHRRRDVVGPLERPAQVFRLAPKLWKAAGAVATGSAPYARLAEAASALEAEHPVALRHLLDVRTAAAAGPPADTAVGEHALPFVISGMSFGSQGEAAFRCYLDAASRLGMIAMNGEGGELPALLGTSPVNRAQQVASGRFGVNAEMLNSCRMIEIKIGQGAKPGEGGHLPGSKVSAKVAQARSAEPGVDLISPANNHDLYSIEDLAQIIAELRTANPEARVAVKIPVTSGVGTIAVGIVKAGADVITLSGYDGGTGAARGHALRHAGLPSDLGVVLAHRALTACGLRGRVELWADGGMRTAQDALRLILLGANRLGFGTMAMVALGCTICRSCQSDTCHVGIATQIEDELEAAERGLPRFVPVVAGDGVARLCRFFTALGDELAELAGGLGAATVQDLVGRSDLLVQARGERWLDLAPLLEPADARDGRFPVLPARRPLALVAVGATRAAPTGTVAGSGLAAFAPAGLALRVRGGGGDGAAKSASGARLVVLKAPDATGVARGGSVGKGFGYGAQRGLFVIQGCADARAGIRLSGADMVIGARPKGRLPRRPAAARAQIKGFAFEYMTAGRAVVLGDVGPWAFAGMTGGVVYVRHPPELGLDEVAIRRRFAAAARVDLRPLDEHGVADVGTLLTAYADELRDSDQAAEAAVVDHLAATAAFSFRAVVPVGQQADQSVSTE